MAGKSRTTGGIAFITNRHDIVESFAAADNILYRFCFASRDVNSRFAHGLDNEWIELTGFQAGAACDDPGVALRNASAIWLRALL